jgi:hypothetical protein
MRTRTATFLALTVCSAPAFATPAYLITSGPALVTFDTDTPAVFGSVATITGLGAGESLVGADFRPANRALVALTRDNAGAGRLYTINTSTAVATFVTVLTADPADITNPYTTIAGTQPHVDINPVPDRLRIVTEADENLRVHMDTGVVTTDAPLQYSPTDANAGENPRIIGVAYTNSFPSSPSTTLYDIDFQTNRLVTQNPPNNGTLNTVGALGATTQIGTGFDIEYQFGSNLAWAALTIGGVSGLYAIDLATGAAALTGNFPGNPAIIDLAVFPDAVFRDGFE